MRLEFTKMHGLGNDFLMLDLVTQRVRLDEALIRRLSDRHFGVGFDQLLVVEPPHQPDVDFRYRIFNADGSEVSQCGNGARCFARFVRDRRLTRKDTLRVETASGIITLQIDSQGWVTVDMGPPRLEPNAIPFVADNAALDYRIEVDGELYQIAAVSMGNPHAVTRVDDVDTAPVATLGPQPWAAEQLAGIPTAVRTRVWRRLLVRAGAPAGAVGVRHTDACDRLLTHWHGQGPVHAPGGLRVLRSGGRVTIGAADRVD